MTASVRMCCEPIISLGNTAGGIAKRIKKFIKVIKPNRNIGMGVNALPASIRESSILSGNDLGQFANSLPDESSVNLYLQNNTDLQKVLIATKNNNLIKRETLHQMAKSSLTEGKVEA